MSLVRPLLLATLLVGCGAGSPRAASSGPVRVDAAPPTAASARHAGGDAGAAPAPPAAASKDAAGSRDDSDSDPPLAIDPKKLEPARAEARALLDAHCVRCHGEGASPNLAVTPELTSELWGKIGSMVETSQMPPPTPTQPFPIDPSIQQRLMKAVETILSARSRVSPQPIIYSASVWSTIVHRVADPSLSPAVVNATLNKYRGGFGGMRDVPAPDPTFGLANVGFPLGQASVNLASHEICRSMLEADSKLKNEKRRFLKDSDGDAPEAKVATALHRIVYQDEPSSQELEKASSTIHRVRARSGSLLRGATALCTAQLSGIRLRMADLADREEHR